jgi:hypothetical protein
MNKEVLIIIQKDGKIIFLDDDSGKQLENKFAKVKKQRASHVLPNNIFKRYLFKIL